jgi:hypothetical protein
MMMMMMMTTSISQGLFLVIVRVFCDGDDVGGGEDERDLVESLCCDQWHNIA